MSMCFTEGARFNMWSAAVMIALPDADDPSAVKNQSLAFS